MSDRPAVLERAYELAKSGSCTSIGDIRAHLRDEGYESVASHLAAPGLSRELRALCKKFKR